MAAKLVVVKYADLTEDQKRTLAWLNGRDGPVSEADVFTSCAGRWLDLPDLQRAGQAFEDSKGWWSVSVWFAANYPFVRQCARRVTRFYRQYDTDEIVHMLLPYLYQFARTMKPDGGATMLTYFGAWAGKNLMRDLYCETPLIRLPKWKGDVRGRGTDALPRVTHFGASGGCDENPAGAPEPFAREDDGRHAEAADVWRTAMKRLPPRYRLVLRRRMQGEQLQNIADDMRLSSERVRQIEFLALNLVRAKFGVPPLKARKRRAARVPGVGK